VWIHCGDDVSGCENSNGWVCDVRSDDTDLFGRTADAVLMNGAVELSIGEQFSSEAPRDKLPYETTGMAWSPACLAYQGREHG
jgi:methenyltetrahydromethanopterin cyclohydrolase